MTSKSFSDFGVPYIAGTYFLDIISVLKTIKENVPAALSVAHKSDNATGQIRIVLQAVGDQRVNFPLEFSQKLTYRSGDATVGWLDDLEPLFSLYRTLTRQN
jgi:hypothetical protein